MARQINIGFLTTVSGRWPRELPNRRLTEYRAWLLENLPGIHLCSYEKVVDSKAEISQAVSLFKQNDVRLIIMLYGAFTGDDVSAAIAEELKIPLILWAPREPELKGGRLLANAMVALTMNSASLYRLGFKSYPVYGGLESDDAKKRILEILKAYDAIYKIKQTTLGLFGYRPTAFYNSAFDEGLIRRTFGVKIEETDLKVVFDSMQGMDQSEVDRQKEDLLERFQVKPGLPEEHLDNHVRLYAALKDLMVAQGYDYAAIKCWPEMGQLKTTPCAVLGRLADDGYAIACEGDVDVSLSMIAQNIISGQTNFVTDMIDINEQENCLTFWHCGNAAPSLHNRDSSAVMGNHPLAGQGTSFYAALKEGPVTISRFCNIDGKYKLFLLRGEATSTELYTPGSMINVKVKAPVTDILYGMITKGVPHHYSIVWCDIADTMLMIAAILGLEVISFDS